MTNSVRPSRPGRPIPNAKTLLRGVPTLGLNFSWPFVKQSGGTTIVLEPIAQLALSPDVKINPEIPNEDSVVFQYDETSLFDADKFPGYDAFDSGQRLNVGGRATFTWGTRPQRPLPGRADLPRRADHDFPAGHRLEQHLIGLGGLGRHNADRWPELQCPRRLIGDQGPVPAGRHRRQLRLCGTVSAYLRYELDNTNPGAEFRDLEGAAEFFVTKHWGIGLSGVRDLQFNAWRLRDVSLIYKDECVQVQVIYQHQDTIQGQLGASDTVLLRLTLATLGAEGYRDTEIPH